MDHFIPNGAEVSRALAAIFAAPEFVRAPVMRHLLTYLVNETLAGRGDRVKAYSVAVDALGRTPDFDAQADSYPRVQVGRLRKMLGAYYAGEPAPPLRLAIPLGGYRVTFAAGGNSDAAAVPVTAQRSTPRWKLLTGIGVALALLLVVAGIVHLVPRTGAMTQPGPLRAPTIAIELGDTATTMQGRVRLAEIGRAVAQPLSRGWLARVVTGGAAVDSRYALLIDLNAAETIASLRLIDRDDGLLLWSEQTTLPVDDAPLAPALRPVISALIRPTGVLAAYQRTETKGSFAPGLPCLLRHDEYYRDRDAAIARPVRHCIARTIADDPGNGAALAAASFLMLDPLSGGGGTTGARRAAAFARRASDAAPFAPDAAIAEARVALVGGNCIRGRTEAERALALDDTNPDGLGVLGLLLIGCDDARSEMLLRDARALDPDLSTFYLPALILGRMAAGDMDAAAAEARAMRPPAAGMRPQYLLSQTLGAIAANDPAAARMHWGRFVATALPSARTVDALLMPHYFSPVFRRRLERRLTASGLTASPPSR